MSDIKRVVLTTLEPQKLSEKVAKKHFKTVRIRVPLPESNEDECPEYSYKDELAVVKKKQKQNGKEANNAQNGLDPFGDENEDDVRRIALAMEAKYGTGVTGGAKKKRKGRKDDYADIGAGYDESDSFIDNTDGYDEIIPHNVTTARGGFYINSGALEFKEDNEATSEVSSSSSEEVSDSEEEDGDNPNKSKRKRALDTSDEENGNSNHSSQEQAQGQKKQNGGDKPNISMHQAIKKKLFSSDKIQNKKRKLSDHFKSPDLLREKRTDINSADLTKDIPKENKKPMRLSSVDAAIDSVIARIEDPNKAPEKMVATQTKVVEKIEDPNKNGDPPSLIRETEPSANDVKKQEFVKLPENLPADILEIINNIKRAAREYKEGGKVKFFSGEVNNLLLSLERKCKVLGRSSRVRVYEHLAPFVRCRKETLVKRAKNLVWEDEQSKLKRTLENLKIQIDQLMPALITNHEKECQRVLQRKFSQEAATNEELKNLKAPRRRFPLHEEMKRMIRDIVTFKKRCFLHEGKPKNVLEDLLSEYLKKEVLILWPDGWMSMTVLKKFCTTMAIKTPDPKTAALANANSNKHSQKLSSSSTSTIINYSAGNNLTITPVNLVDKLSEVSNNNVNSLSSKPDTIIKPLAVEKSPETVLQTIVKPVELTPPDKIAKPSYKEKSDHLQETKDNGVIVLSSKTKEEPVIQKETHCQVIDLTDTPIKNSVIEDTNRAFQLSREASTNPDFEAALKTKFPGLSVTATNPHPHNDRDDVQKVMESLKALQKLSSPSKNEISNPAVSVIAYNKNYSNSNSSQSSGVNNERTNFSGAIGFQDEFQKQFISSLNHKSPPPSAPPPKQGFNRCS